MSLLVGVSAVGLQSLLATAAFTEVYSMQRISSKTHFITPCSLWTLWSTTSTQCVPALVLQQVAGSAPFMFGHQTSLWFLGWRFLTHLPLGGAVSQLHDWRECKQFIHLLHCFSLSLYFSVGLFQVFMLFFSLLLCEKTFLCYLCSYSWDQMAKTSTHLPSYLIPVLTIFTKRLLQIYICSDTED
jgi:hypothetical protein